MDHTAKRLQREKSTVREPRRSLNPHFKGNDGKQRFHQVCQPSRAGQKLIGRAFSALLAICFLLSSLAAGSAAVRLDVFLGYDGILPEASWFPVSFEVQNYEPSFT